MTDSGRPGGLSSDDGTASVSTLRASIPDAGDDMANEAARLGILYDAEKFGSGCTDLVCVFPHGGNCICFNRALSLYVSAKAIETGTDKTEGLGPKDDSAVGETDLPNPTPKEPTP